MFLHHNHCKHSCFFPFIQDTFEEVDVHQLLCLLLAQFIGSEAWKEEPVHLPIQHCCSSPYLEPLACLPASLGTWPSPWPHCLSSQVLALAFFHWRKVSQALEERRRLQGRVNHVDEDGDKGRVHRASEVTDRHAGRQVSQGAVTKGWTRRYSLPPLDICLSFFFVNGTLLRGEYSILLEQLFEYVLCFLEKKRQKKAKLTKDWRERRNAIRLTNEYTLETLVVADTDMVQYHGADAAQRFILTVMNMVGDYFLFSLSRFQSRWRQIKIDGMEFDCCSLNSVLIMGWLREVKNF